MPTSLIKRILGTSCLLRSSQIRIYLLKRGFTLNFNCVVDPLWVILLAKLKNHYKRGKRNYFALLFCQFIFGKLKLLQMWLRIVEILKRINHRLWYLIFQLIPELFFTKRIFIRFRISGITILLVQMIKIYSPSHGRLYSQTNNCIDLFCHCKNNLNNITGPLLHLACVMASNLLTWGFYRPCIAPDGRTRLQISA